MDNQAKEFLEKLPTEEEATFYGKVLAALSEYATKHKQKPDKILVHYRLYEQLVPLEQRAIGRPIIVFTVPLVFEIGVPYGEFMLEGKITGKIKGF